jgi:hypothetical protein
MGRSIRRKAAQKPQLQEEPASDACQYIVIISSTTKQKRQPTTQNQLNTLRTRRFNNATAPHTKIQLPKRLYIT